MATKVQVYSDPASAGWSVKVTGDEETETQRFDEKEQAVEAGRQLASERGAELVVHDEQGITEEKEKPA